MKLLRYGAPGEEKPGLLDDDGVIRDLSGVVRDIEGAELAPDRIDALRALDPARLPAVGGTPRIGPCVGRVGKLIAIGLNYADHAAELNMALPEDPVIFLKATSSICGAFDDIERPRGSTRLDWEVELGIVIGRAAKYVSAEDAPAHIAGYCVVNDVSERDFQLARSGQWTKGKSHDTFGPIGPWLVTPDEVGDPRDLTLWLKVNGTRMQDGSTRTMHFGPAEIVAAVSGVMSLQPGDVIATGTPPGVGMGHDPQVFLQPGDVVEAGIEKLGEQRMKVVQA